MPIEIVPHALEQAAHRGVSRAEVLQALENGIEAPARRGRSARELTFEYNDDWNGKIYSHKRVKVIFVIEGDTTVVITVLGFYGRWDD